MTTRTGKPEPRDAGREGVVALDLGPTPAVRISGPDARRFCNGMFTNNIRDLAVGQTNRSAMVEDRGRIEGFLDLLCEGPDRFLAVLDGKDGTGFLARYEKYVVFDDVTLDDLGDTLAIVSLQGPDAAAAVVSVGLAAPPPGGFLVADDAVVFARTRSPAGGYDVVVPAAALEAWRSRIGAVASWATPEQIEVLRVTGGRPRFPADTGDKRLPHELGLRDELLSFDKGCYIGQESINRIDVMGQVKRMLVGVRFPGTVLPPAGAEVRAGDAVIGELTSPVLLPGDGVFGLAVLKKPADTPGTAVQVVGAADPSSPGSRPETTWTGVVEALPFTRDG